MGGPELAAYRAQLRVYYAISSSTQSAARHIVTARLITLQVFGLPRMRCRVTAVSAGRRNQESTAQESLGN